MHWDWLHVVVYIGAVVGLGFAILGISALLGPRRPSASKLETYECGVPVLSSARERFGVHFYLVALLFILFDIETIFLIPWAVLHRSLGVAGLLEMGVFLFVIVFGLLYVWRRGALEWE